MSEDSEGGRRDASCLRLPSLMCELGLLVRAVGLSGSTGVACDQVWHFLGRQRRFTGTAILLHSVSCCFNPSIEPESFLENLALCARRMKMRTRMATSQTMASKGVSHLPAGSRQLRWPTRPSSVETSQKQRKCHATQLCCIVCPKSVARRIRQLSRAYSVSCTPLPTVAGRLWLTHGLHASKRVCPQSTISKALRLSRRKAWRWRQRMKILTQ